jgi:hypothetical protein
MRNSGENKVILCVKALQQGIKDLNVQTDIQ